MYVCLSVFDAVMDNSNDLKYFYELNHSCKVKCLLHMAQLNGCLVGMGRQYSDPVVAAATLDFLNHNKTKLMTAHAALLPQVRSTSSFVHTSPYLGVLKNCYLFSRTCITTTLCLGLKKSSTMIWCKVRGIMRLFYIVQHFPLLLKVVAWGDKK